MGWEDRDYNRSRPASGWTPLSWFMYGSLPLFTAVGIRVRMHSSMLILIAFTLITSEFDGLGWRNGATSMVVLFGSVLLHEFGHCFGCRWVGGRAEDVMLWPLGGLASVDPPRRPGADLITTAAGPAVNLILCGITAGMIAWVGTGYVSFPWFPFGGRHAVVPAGDPIVHYLWWIFSVNYALFMFNMLLVFYPFDAGRIVQGLLWIKVGYYRSMRFATIFGMYGAGALAVVGFITLAPLLLMIAGFGFYTCWQQRRILIESGAEYADETDYSAAYEQPRSGRRVKTARQLRAAKRARQIAAEHQQEQQVLDAILAKVSAQGMNSLTRGERKTLKQATENRRRQDVEV
jgi:hypothetical protein